MKRLVVLVFLFLCCNCLPSLRASEVLQGLRNPPRSCTQIPFWFWNGPLRPEELGRQLKEMAEKGVYAAMPHPRYGMDRRFYLEEPFWRCVERVIKEAEKLGMRIWLYDEYNWPSGGAGGRVTDGRPELYPRGLDYVRKVVSGPVELTICRPSPSDKRMARFEKIKAAFFRPSPSNGKPFRAWGKISPDGKSVSGKLGEGSWEILVFFQCLGRNPSPLDIGSCSMTDYLSARPARRFLSLTHKQYYRRFGKHFGSLIPGVFTDEASTTSPGPFPWTEGFAEQYRKSWGKPLLPFLPALLEESFSQGPFVRLAYWQTVTDLFKKGFLGTVHKWCKEHSLILTGHVFEEDIRFYAHAPQLMELLRELDLPGFDALGPICPPRNAKTAISVGQLEGKLGALCECLGLAGGWNATLGMLRNGYNTLGVLGVTHFVPHAFFQTVENPRVECPPSFFEQNPYWKYYRKIADLSSRLSFFNRTGVHCAPCAVYYPSESLWADSTGGKGQGCLPWQHTNEGNENASETANVFNALLDQLFWSRWDLDVVDSKLLRESVPEAAGRKVYLRIGPERFRVVVVPPVTAVGKGVLRALDSFLRKGGIVVWLKRLPSFVWPPEAGEPERTLRKWFPQETPRTGRIYEIGRGKLAYLKAAPEAVKAFLRETLSPPLEVTAGLSSILLCHRKTEERDLFLLFNPSDKGVSGEIRAQGLGLPVLVDLDDGKAYRAREGKRGFSLYLKPHQCVAALFGEKPAIASLFPFFRFPPEGEGFKLKGPWEILLAGGELDDRWSPEVESPVRVELPVFRIKKRSFQAIPHWNEPGFDDGDWKEVPAVRGKALSTEPTSLLFRAILPPGAFALSLPLPVEGEYMVWINGELEEKRIGPPPEGGTLSIEGFVKGTGDLLALETFSHFTSAGLKEPISVLCKPVEIPELRSWKDLGFGYYSGRVRYRKRITIPEEAGRVWLDLGEVQHYAEVWLNGKLAGLCLWAPYLLEVTDFVKPGPNELVVVVSNSIANRFSWDVWGTRGRGKAEPSGLLGPVSLLLQK